MKNIIWLRHENRLTERRTPLLPRGAELLINSGYNVIVERSGKRIIPDRAYAEAGCRMVEGGAWIKAPKEAVILGLKELPDRPAYLKNTHIYFAHAYKEQAGWQNLLRRFTSGGGGSLLDIEYMVDPDSKRVVAFGYRAGYMGAALALIHWYNRQGGPRSYLDHGLTPFDTAEMLHDCISQNRPSGKIPKILIIGASGRCGHGARDLLNHYDTHITCWGRQETRHIDRAALLTHDIVINCTFIRENIPPFIRRQDLIKEARLSVIADISCDPFSTFNPVPLYHDVTSWDRPYVTTGTAKAVDIIAIDNLPSLLPREASEEFADQLLPHLLTLKMRDRAPVWGAARASFDRAVAAMDNEKIHATG